MTLAHVCAGHDSKTADQAGCEIGNDISIQVRQQKYVESLRTDYELHRSIVYDQFLVANLWKLSRRFPAATQKQTIRELHDVRLMDRGYLLAPILCCVLER